MSPDFPTDPALPRIDRETVVSAITEGRGAGLRIAVIDSGIETGHPGLAGLQLADDLAVTLRGGQLRIDSGDGEDIFGHGTAVAGIIRQIAPAAEIGSFRIIGLGSGGAQAQVIREAVRLAFDRGYHILNCSFGCIARTELLPGFKNWIDEAYLRNVHIVAASNNQDSGTVEWPSHFPTVLSVSHLEGCTRESLHFRRNQLVQFGALGAESEALWISGGVKQVIGSSFASPRLAGFLARLLSIYPATSVLLAKEAIARYASAWPASRPEPVVPME